MKSVIGLLLCMGIATAAVYAQSAKERLDITDRVTLNLPDRKVIAYTRPVKEGMYTLPDRAYFWYGSNQVRSTQGGYSGKLLNGPYAEYYLNKNLKEQGQFKNGLKTGIWKTWTDAGKLVSQYTWNTGRQQGRYSKYDANGRLAESGRMRNGQLNGTVRIWHSADSNTSIYYRNGQKTDRKPFMPAFIRNLFKKKDKTPVIPAGRKDQATGGK